jgi:hypothetical protein
MIQRSAVVRVRNKQLAVMTCVVAVPTIFARLATTDMDVERSETESDFAINCCTAQPRWNTKIGGLCKKH